MTRLAATVLLVLAVGGSAGASGADFTASSYSTASITTAADFNTVVVNITNPGSPLADTVALNATATSDRGITSVKIQCAPTGTGDWVDICTATSAPYSCSLDTLPLADQNYDFKAIATDSAGYSKTSTVTNRAVDNYTLSVTLNDPGAIGGTVNLTANASGASPGLQGVKIQQRAAGATTWNDVCAFQATTPRTCSFDTTAFADGNRELRAVATDTGGHTAQTAAITRLVDNSPPTSTSTVPPTGSGTVSMTATATDTGSGIAYVAWEAFYMGQWYEFCRDTSSPYACTGDSTAVADGTYQVHTVTVNNAGVKTTSPASQIVIDNNAPVGTDITTFNGGATAGRIEVSDWIRLTWSEPIAPASIVSGWSGSSRAITVRISDAGTNDQMDFYDGDDATKLNLVSTAADLKLGGDYVPSLVKYQATMVQSGNSITITFGNLISGSPNTAAAGTITWKPSAAATDLVGHPSSTALVTEPGALDLDF